MQIITAAHSNQITKQAQLTLHSGLGCVIGAGMSGGGSGCASGAVAGVIGEFVASAMYQEGGINADKTLIGFNGNTSIAIGGLSGSLASALTSIALGDDDNKVAKNISAGNFVATNAAVNNAVFKKRPLKDTEFLGIESTQLGDKLNIELLHEQLFFEDEKGGNIGYFSDNKLRPDDSSFLNNYFIAESGFDDETIREAVKNVIPKPYNLLDMSHFCAGKYNCQDWAQDVRNEYYKLQKQRR